MPNADRASIREILLTVTAEQEPKGQGGASLQHTSVINEAYRRLGRPHEIEIQEALLTEWHELMRSGHFAWGFNVSNINPPFFHITSRGRQTLALISRDPGNPAGYMRHLESAAAIDPICRSYVTEALACFNLGLFKAAAVMTGAASEALILNLRDAIRSRPAGVTGPKALDEWQVKRVLGGIQNFLGGHKGAFPNDLREDFEAYWPAFAGHIRTTRNDAGHPISIDPVSEDAVHAALLIFPEMAGLTSRLTEWVNANL